MKKNCLRNNVRKKTEDPQLQKLTVYHNHLPLQANNILTKKVSRKVAAAVNDLSRIDDAVVEGR